MQILSTFGRDARAPFALVLMTSSFAGLVSNPASAQDAAALATRPPIPMTRPEPSADWTRMPDALRAAANSASDELLFDTVADGALWVRGESYKARFAADGATIVPFFGSDAPQDYPLEFRAANASVGGVALESATAPHVTRAGDTVRIERGAFVEEYELTTTSLEQRFVFDHLDRTGELVVRFDAASELAGSDLGDTLRFENERGHIDYGQAFAVDANGKRVALDSTLVDGAIELHVPSAFVASAALPLVVDPLITAYTAGGTTLWDIYPDVSYDVSTDRWCIVWVTVYSATDHDSYARLATGAYQLLPGMITLDFTSDTWTTPKIANNNGANQFLVCFAVVPAGSGLADIRGRFIDPATATTTGVPFQISPPDGAYRNWPDVGGDPYPGTTSYYCVVWQRSVSATNVDIEARMVSTAGTLVSNVFPLANDPGLDILPTISNSAGVDVSDGTVGWTAVWEYEYSPSDHDIYGAQIYWDGSIVHPMFPIDISGWDDTNPVASSILDSTTLGVARPYMVAFERDYGDHDIIGGVLQGSTLLYEIDLVGPFPSSTWYRMQTDPALDSDGSQFLFGFTERDTPTAYNGDTYICDYFWDGATLGACELRKSLGGTSQDEGDVAIHSMASSGGAPGMYLATYAYASANNGYDVIGALWQGCSSEVETVCTADGSIAPCPCGTNGSFGHGCANSAHPEGALLGFTGDAIVSADTAAFHASSMPSNVACLFFEGTSLSQPAPFGNGLRCVTGATLRFPLKHCDASGSVSYPQIGDAPISAVGLVPSFGGTRYYQAWYRDPAAACTSTFNLSNALRVTWVP